MFAKWTPVLIPCNALGQLPTGGNVVAGAASIATANGYVNVTATAPRSVIDWDSFSVGAGQVANFDLPSASSAILNRVTGVGMSQIDGTVTSNGNVHLVNPNGIMIGSSGMINTNGFTASVLDVTNEDFVKGGPLTFSGSSAASIVNQGAINTGSGGAHLIANQISNSGEINAVGGNITLSSGGVVTLDNGVTYAQPSLATLSGGINPTAGLIQNTGAIRATGVATAGGEIYLVSANGAMLHDGTIQASRSVTDLVTDTDTYGGNVLLEGDTITLGSNSSIDASGSHGGGEVLVGAAWEGGVDSPKYASGRPIPPRSSAFAARASDMTHASSITVESGSQIDASATAQGDGGTIVLFAFLTKLESVNQTVSQLVVRAGALMGSGGRIETSGVLLDSAEITVDASADNGANGLWLIDPFNESVGSTGALSITKALNTGTDVTLTTKSSSTVWGPTRTSSSIVLGGDVKPDSLQSDTTLTFDAENDITLLGEIDATPADINNTSKLTVALSGKNVTIGQDISVTGDVHIEADAMVSGSGSVGSQNLTLSGQGSVELTNPANNVGSIQSTATGDLQFVNSTELTVDGINSNGVVDIQTLDGDLIVAGDVSTTDSSENAIVLNAGASATAGTSTGSNVQILGDATIEVGAGGRATIYTDSVLGSTGVTDAVGYGSGQFRYNSDESQHNFTKSLGSGVYAIYREQPAISGSFITSSVYGDQPFVTAINGDQLAVSALAPDYSTSGNLVVGTYNAQIADGAAETLGYSVIPDIGSLTVSKRVVSTYGISVSDRFFDGTRNATVDHSGVGFVGLMSGDNLEAFGTRGLFDDASIGTGKAVSLFDTQYRGDDLGNYLVQDQLFTTASILPTPDPSQLVAVGDMVFSGGFAYTFQQYLQMLQSSQTRSSSQGERAMSMNEASERLDSVTSQMRENIQSYLDARSAP